MAVERYMDQDILLALVVRSEFSEPGIHFFTDSDSTQQLGYMRRLAGHEVKAHRHNVVPRVIETTQEVLFIKRGLCQLNLYGSDNEPVHSVELSSGDVVLLAAGGHGLVMLEESEILEVKQGPYGGEADKSWISEKSREK